MFYDSAISSLVFAQLKTQPDNELCFDCGEKCPQFASITNGIFLCLGCAGHHRGLGTQYSIVRGLELDNWSENQLKIMSLGGNMRLKKYLSEYDLLEVSPAERYTTVAADFYRRTLRYQMENKPFFEDAPSKEEG